MEAAMGSAKDQLFDTAQASIDHHVAEELGISEDDLAQFPYELDENASDDGVSYGWVVRWDDGAPPGVNVTGGVSFIQALHEEEPEEPEQD
jgi:hypothetical protein